MMLRTLILIAMVIGLAYVLWGTTLLTGWVWWLGLAFLISGAVGAVAELATRRQ